MSERGREDQHPSDRRPVDNETVLAELAAIRRSTGRWKTFALLTVAVLAGFLSGPVLRRFTAAREARDMVTAPADVRAALSEAMTIDIGDSAAAVEVFQVTDMQCPFCAAVEPSIVEAIKSEFVRPGSARLRIVQMPIDAIHPHARVAGRLMLCVDRIAGDRVEQAMAGLYETQREWGGQGKDDARQVMMRQLASQGVDTAAVASCEASDDVDRAIGVNQRVARNIRVPGTPAFYLNGVRLPPDSAAIVDAVRAQVARRD